MVLFFSVFSESTCDKIFHYKMQFYVGIIGKFVVVLLYFGYNNIEELFTNQPGDLYDFVISVTLAALVCINGYRSWYEELEEKYKEENIQHLMNITNDNIVDKIDTQIKGSKKFF